MKHKVYLSGPMTGKPDYKERFDSIAADLESNGHVVLNPAALPKGLAYGEYFPICIQMIEAAETILMLPGWGKSKGACMEHLYARTVGKDVEYFTVEAAREKPTADIRSMNW